MEANCPVVCVFVRSGILPVFPENSAILGLTPCGGCVFGKAGYWLGCTFGNAVALPKVSCYLFAEAQQVPRSRESTLSGLSLEPRIVKYKMHSNENEVPKTKNPYLGKRYGS
jgi:hypothetical protein